MSEMELHQIRVTTALKDIPALTAPVLHLAIALWGLVDCFFGLRLFTITVKILMAFAFGLAAAAVSLQLKPDSAAWLVGASVAGLILGLILGWVLYRLGVALTAVFAGFVLSVPLAAAFPAEYTLFIRCGVAALAGVVVFLLMEPTIIVSTAVTGAFRMVYGAAFFIGGVNLLDFVSGARGPMELFTGVSAPFAAIALFVAVLGIVVQFRARYHGREEKAEEED
jgi:hypothetical protein